MFPLIPPPDAGGGMAFLLRCPETYHTRFISKKGSDWLRFWGIRDILVQHATTLPET